jgi:hypothetical protein
LGHGYPLRRNAYILPGYIQFHAVAVGQAKQVGNGYCSANRILRNTALC